MRRETLFGDWFLKVRCNPIRISGARNGVDGYGRGWFNWEQTATSGGTYLSGFEMGNPVHMGNLG
jgi:hypothetical protein